MMNGIFLAVSILAQTNSGWGSNPPDVVASAATSDLFARTPLAVSLRSNAGWAEDGPATTAPRPLALPQGNPRPQLLRRVVPVVGVAPRVIYGPTYAPPRATYAVPVVRVPVYQYAPVYSVGGCANGQCSVPQRRGLFGR